MRTQVLSYGGGVQTVGVIAMIAKGIIEKPDMIVMADTGREASSTFDYMEEIVSPALAQMDLGVSIAPHSLATVDLYAGNGDLLLPMWTPTGKMPTFCSVEWKERVIKRWLREQGVDECDAWLCFSLDEQGRAKPVKTVWYQRRFPLLEKMMTRSDCINAIKAMGWPIPPKSSCWMCPNRTDSEWASLTNEELRQAIELEREVREFDENLFLHHSRKPLGEVAFDAEDKSARHVQCGFGYCFI